MMQVLYVILTWRGAAACGQRTALYPFVFRQIEPRPAQNCLTPSANQHLRYLLCCETRGHSNNKEVVELDRSDQLERKSSARRYEGTGAKSVVGFFRRIRICSFALLYSPCIGSAENRLFLISSLVNHHVMVMMGNLSETRSRDICLSLIPIMI